MVDPIGKKWGMILLWRNSIQICQFIKNDFCMEVEIEGDGFEGRCWVVFIYASVEEYKRRWQ